MDQSAQVPSYLDENPGDLIREHRQYYLMVNAIARRTRQLQTGDRALALPADGNRDPMYIATQEFLEDKLAIVERIPGADFLEEEAPEVDLMAAMDDDDLSFDSDDDED